MLCYNELYLHWLTHVRHDVATAKQFIYPILDGKNRHSLHTLLTSITQSEWSLIVPVMCVRTSSQL